MNLAGKLCRYQFVDIFALGLEVVQALEVGADAILAAYVVADTPIRWTPIAQKLGVLEPEKQDKIETLLDCMIKTI